MNRNELQDMILDTRKMLAFYEGITTNCVRCDNYHQQACKHHGPVPAEYAEQTNDCPQWELDDVPF